MKKYLLDVFEVKTPKKIILSILKSDTSFEKKPVNKIYACQVLPQELQTVGFLSAKRDNKPNGKKHIDTIICQVWYPPFWVVFLHSGQVSTAIFYDLVYNNIDK